MSSGSDEDTSKLDEEGNKRFPHVEIKPVIIDGQVYIKLNDDYEYQTILQGVKMVVDNRRANFLRYHKKAKKINKKPPIKKVSLADLFVAPSISV